VIADLSREHHVVVPSIPGFGFSVPVSGAWDVSRTAAAFVSLMQSLRYDRYGIQAGDVGAGIAGAMSRLTPAVAALHINGLSAHPFAGPLPYDRGGHFPAIEVPGLHVADVLKFFPAGSRRCHRSTVLRVDCSGLVDQCSSTEPEQSPGARQKALHPTAFLRGADTPYVRQKACWGPAQPGEFRGSSCLMKDGRILSNPVNPDR
jgi:pimeloyl-ACP methyl ester carboxylesterase